MTPLCYHCRHPATVFVRSEAYLTMGFAAPTCDAYAARIERYCADMGYDLEFLRVHGVDYPSAIEDVDLTTFVGAVLECAIGDHDALEVRYLANAVAIVVHELQQRLHRRLIPSERANVQGVVLHEYNARQPEAYVHILPPLFTGQERRTS